MRWHKIKEKANKLRRMMKDEILKQTRIFYNKQGETEETLEPCKRGSVASIQSEDGEGGYCHLPSRTFGWMSV